MDRDEVWQTIDAERLALAGLLEGLAPEEWEHPSLCADWRVRDVAAHLSMAPEFTLGSALVELARARGGYNRMVRETARRKAARPTGELVADLRGIVGLRRLAPGTTPREPLLDVLVHGQDIALPLGRHRAMPLTAARVSADRAWALAPLFFHRRRLRGLRLVATDVPWAKGEGPEVTGPIEALLLLVTGRTAAALPRLTGPGTAELTRRS
ncbi:uncharacterized protein (TIGR03083 family) [Spinactinospora alkalitolerans]|uniref:Uncharacterized protein (TIGR03083 family) n=1 Tax=Spinactinospora alkalitolerans TaxID=687207 RepID=A0A852U3W8_9ACTN|nr:maleylpyruvate isomerase family mycothiol-dependent enzyme [Spinactinospora alkalitolerans]NYE50287.1 uncharacterized protein (TIGR03083 family) [Spinactinospora alkalitolerans]